LFKKVDTHAVVYFNLSPLMDFFLPKKTLKPLIMLEKTVVIRYTKVKTCALSLQSSRKLLILPRNLMIS